MGGFSRLLLSCFSGSGCIGRSLCLLSETLLLYWASIVMCVADANFRHNNRTDNLFPVLLYIVPRSLQPDKSTHVHFSSDWLLKISTNPHKDIFGFKLLLAYILCQLVTILKFFSRIFFFDSLTTFIGWEVGSHTKTTKHYDKMYSWMHSNEWLSLTRRDVDV